MSTGLEQERLPPPARDGAARARGGVRVRGVTKRFAAVTAVDAVDLDVERGEVVALLGANGAGKSTLLRILGTTVIPDAGSVSVAGVDVLAAPREARRATGLLLAEERSLYWRLTGRQNLEFFAALHGLDRGACRRRVEELLAEDGLADAADRRVGEYSGGMRLRLALLRALITEPPVLLLDEPTRTLDPMASREFRARTRALADERRTAVLVATHDLHEAAEIADRVAIMRSGRICHREPGGASAATLEHLLLESA